MTFEQFAAVVRDWMNRLTPAQARSCAEGFRRQVYISDLPDEIPLDAVLAAIARGGPAPEKAAPKPPQRQAVNSPRKVRSRAGQGLRGRPSMRAQALVREQLANGPRRGEDVQAAAHLADISERSLIAAASSLGVRSRKGQWWLPTAPARTGWTRSGSYCLRSGRCPASGRSSTRFNAPGGRSWLQRCCPSVAPAHYWGNN